MNIYHEFEIVADLAGGLPATLPPEGDFYHEQIGPLLEKYMMRNPEHLGGESAPLLPSPERCDLLRSGDVAQIAGLHGGGSPVMEAIAILGTMT